jgi:DNA-binding XRE family transcriptional regulator
VLSHPEWPLAESVRHLKKTMRLTTAEMAKLSGVACRTMLDIEQQRSEGRVQTMNRIFEMLGLKLAVPLGCLLVGGLAPLFSVTASAVPEAWEAFKV